MTEQLHQAVSVVVPTFNSPGTLPDLCDGLERHVRPITEDLEVIFVDDGSSGDTWQSIQALADERPWVRGIRLLRNYGQHNALFAGLRAARHPIVITIDDDLQNPPDQIPILLAHLTEDIDLVYGSPRVQPQGVARNAASRASKRAMSLALGPDVYPRSSAFRAFRAELVQAGNSVADPYISIDVLLSWATTRVIDVQVDFAERTAGSSGYSVRRLVRHGLNMATGYSTRPLRWVIALGSATAVAGFVLLVYVLGRWLFGDVSVAGFTFLAAAVTLFSGVQLLCLGVLGEYIGRIHFRTMGKPPYVVRDVAPHRSASPMIADGGPRRE